MLLVRNVGRICDGLREVDALLAHNLEACLTAAVAGPDMMAIVLLRYSVKRSKMKCERVSEMMVDAWM